MTSKSSLIDLLLFLISSPKKRKKEEEEKASGRLPRTSQNQRVRAVGMLNSGTSVSATARQYKLERSGSERLLGCGCTATKRLGSFLTDPAVRSPRRTTRQQDRYYIETSVIVTHLRNRFQPATVTAGTVPGLGRIRSGLPGTVCVTNKPTSKTSCYSSHTTLNLVIFQMNPF